MHATIVRDYVALQKRSGRFIWGGERSGLTIRSGGVLCGEWLHAFMGFVGVPGPSASARAAASCLWPRDERFIGLF